MKRILIVMVASLAIALGLSTQTGSAARIDSSQTIEQATNPDRGMRDSGYQSLEPQIAPAPGVCVAVCDEFAPQ